MYFEVRLQNMRALDSFYYTAAPLFSPPTESEWKYSKILLFTGYRPVTLNQLVAIFSVALAAMHAKLIL